MHKINLPLAVYLPRKNTNISELNKTTCSAKHPVWSKGVKLLARDTETGIRKFRYIGKEFWAKNVKEVAFKVECIDTNGMNTFIYQI